jgi:hypothetical protein
MPLPRSQAYNPKGEYLARRPLTLNGVAFDRGDVIPAEHLEPLGDQRIQGLIDTLLIWERGEFEASYKPREEGVGPTPASSDPARAGRPTGEGLHTFETTSPNARDKATLQRTDTPSGKPHAIHKGGGKYVVVDETGTELPDLLTKKEADEKVRVMLGGSADAK